eukprot:scaffold8564_cov32-Attheya_sp.AAC.1
MEKGEKSHQDREATDNEEHENGNTSNISRSSSVSASIANSVGEIQEVTEAPNILLVRKLSSDMNVIMEEGEKSHQDQQATDNEERENGNTIISRSSSVSVSASIANS